MAALLPARQAAAVDPVQALQKGKYQVLSAGESRARAVAAAVLGGASLLCLFFAQSRVLFYGGYVCAVVAALLTGPFLLLVAPVTTPLTGSAAP